MKENETSEEYEARIERECVEWVFGLTGGELEDKPWEPFEPHPEMSERDAAFDAEYRHSSSNPRPFRYWYDGVPSYVGRREFPRSRCPRFGPGAVLL
jgi:ferric-dicitrate binding protein FerR (iron transport regulator)